MTTRRAHCRGRRVLPGASVASAAFVPTQLTGLAAWYDAKDAGTIHLSGSNVTQWDDKSGNTRNVVQGTGANQPTYTANGGSGGQPAIQYSGTKLLATSATFSISTTSIFVVGKFSGTAGIIIEHGTNGTNAGGNYLYGTTNDSSSIRRGANISSRNVSANWAVNSVFSVFEQEFDGTHAGHKVWRDGVDQAAGNGVSGTVDPGTGSNTAASLMIGCRSGLTLPTTGDVYEVLLYTPQLSSANMLLVRQYLKAKWGTP